MANKAKAKRAYRRKAKSRALTTVEGVAGVAALSPRSSVERIGDVVPAAEDVILGTVQSVELLPDGTKRITYASLKAHIQGPDGSKRWEYYPSTAGF